jgi:putative ABC transport system permease protein
LQQNCFPETFIQISYIWTGKQSRYRKGGLVLIELDFIDLGWALGMVAIAIGLSAWQGLGLEGAIAIAAGRTLIQLILVGYVLAVVFDPEGKNPWLVLAVLAIMLTTASMVASNRISKKIKN